MTEQATNPTPVEPSVRSRTASEALAATYRTSEAAAVYGDDHPAVREQAEGAAAGLRSVLVDGQPLVLAVTDGGFHFDEEPVVGTDAVAALARRMHERDVGLLRVTADISARHVLDMTALLRRPDGIEELIEATDTATDGAITFEPLSFHRLRAGPRGAGGQSQAAPTPTWTDLARTLLDPSACSPEQLAEAITEAGVDDPEPLRLQLQQLTSELDSCDAGDRRRTVRRLTRFLVGLNPDLRQALLAVERNDLDQSVAVLDLLVAVMPIDEVLTALEALDDADARPSKEAIRLYTKLARIAHRVPAHANRIQTLFAQTGVEPLLAQERHREVGLSIQETLSSSRAADFNPYDYDSALDSLCSFSAGSEPGEVLREIDPAELRVAAATRALDLLSMPEEGLAPVLDGPLHLFAAMSQALLQQGRLDLVAAGVRAAAAAVDRPSSETQRVAAARLLEEVRSPAFVEAVLDLCTDDEVPVECIELLRRGGSTALAALLRRPAAPTMARILGELQVAAAVLRDAVRLLAAEGQDGLDSLRRLLTLTQDDQLETLVTTLACDVDPELRAVSLQALTGESAGRLPCAVIVRALFDQQRSIRQLAVERLCERTDPAAVEATVHVLSADDETGGVIPELEIYDRLLDAVAGRPDSVQHLARIVRRHAWSMSTLRSLVSWRVAKQLWRQRAGGRMTLLAWLLSPAPVLLAFDVFNRPLWGKKA